MTGNLKRHAIFGCTWRCGLFKEENKDITNAVECPLL